MEEFTVKVGIKELLVTLEASSGKLYFFTNLYAGNAYNIVVAERVVLNFMQRMSGIATLTKVCPFSSF